jgi:hypothetical protein
MTNSDDTWITDQRTNVLLYAQKNCANFGMLGEWPAFCVPHCLAIWAVESTNHPTWVSFWVFPGDLPTDVICRDWDDDQDNPRKALYRMINVWKTYFPYLENGQSPPTMTLGNGYDQRIQMSQMLLSRCSTLESWLYDDGIWEDDCQLGLTSR